LVWLQDGRVRWGFVAAGIVVLAATHWLVPRPEKQFHNLIYHLNFIPILMAGMLFGWRASVLATALTATAEFPLAWMLWRGDQIYLADQIGETAVFCAAGVVAGFLSSRERRQKAELAATTHELEKVYLELKQNLERLKRAERMSALAQFSARLAHEIRNPLAGLAGAAGILKRGHASSENVEACLEIIDKESNRLNKLLANFLNFARPWTPRFQSTDLTEVMESVILLARHSPEAGAIEFRRLIDGPLPLVDSDGEQLKQVLINLVMNAIQATGSGTVELRAWAANGSAFVAIRDAGPGVPEAEHDRIFEPFFTTRENGTGLGLAIAAKIIEQHGGTLTAGNAAGGGFMVTVQLPVEQKAAV
jgi:two-component system sensor histidine kinase HydH